MSGVEELDDESGLLTVAEAAARVHVSASAVRAWVRRGHVAAVKYQGRVLVGEQSLLDCDLAMRTSDRGGQPRRAVSGG
ncbi:helix-turn-helix domain-containing protein [Ornithinimicrobium sp. Arc0846-15]|nr:helix-turn-helix domain-containing protein [Ornithinimicrobium laminariae]